MTISLSRLSCCVLPPTSRSLGHAGGTAWHAAASRSCILHAKPTLRKKVLNQSGRSPPTPAFRVPSKLAINNQLSTLNAALPPPSQEAALFGWLMQAPRYALRAAYDLTRNEFLVLAVI